MRHVISITVNNKHGVLARIAGLFSARGYNIESLNVASLNENGMGSMTIVVHGEELVIEQIKKQLNKIIDVLKVVDVTGENYIDRELVLIKVASSSSIPVSYTHLRAHET